MKRVTGMILVAVGVLSVRAAEFRIPELQMMVAVPDEKEWTVERQGDSNSDGGFSFSLTRIGTSKIFAVTGRRSVEGQGGPLSLTAREEKEAAALGTELSRRRTTVAGVEALELRLEAETENEMKRVVVQLFHAREFRCCVISIVTGSNKPGFLRWPDEDEDLRPLFLGVRELEEPSSEESVLQQAIQKPVGSARNE